MLVCDDDRLTYAEAEVRSRAIARGLIDRGASRGTHVGILFPTGVDFVVSWLAATRIGAVAVPISTFSTADELRGLLADADIAALIAIDGYRGHDYVARLQEAIGADLSRPGELHVTPAPALRHVFMAGTPDGVHPDHTIDSLCLAGASVDDAHFDAIEADVSPDDRMVIVYTSGSTSAPKGVIHQHGTLIRHVANLNDAPRPAGRGQALLQLATLLDRRSRATTSSARSSPVPPWCARTASTVASPSTSSNANAPNWSTASSNRSPTS